MRVSAVQSLRRTGKEKKRMGEVSGSLRGGGEGQRARGRVGAEARSPAISVTRGGRRRRGGAPRLFSSRGSVETAYGSTAELEVTSEGHGEGCGRGGARRQSRRPRTERREEAEEGKRSRERGERTRGSGGCAWRRPGSRGGHAGREEPARLAGHRARSCFSSWQEEEDSAAPGGPGWLWPVGHYSGGLHGKVPLFFIFPVFYYSATLWLY